MSRVEVYGSKHFKELGCFEPVPVYDPKTNTYEPRPCGHCLPCLRRRQTEWVTRLVEQLRQYPSSSYFVTLTYRDDQLPFDKELGICVYKPHITKLHRDLRKRFQQGFFTYKNFSDLGLVSEKIELEKDRPFKYYLTSEYSPSMRPHYHAVYFNLPEDRYLVNLLFESVWNKGMVRVYPASPESIGYITKYLVNSKISEGYDPIHMVHPFSMMSKNLGKSYIERMRAWHLDSVEDRYSYTVYHNEKSVMPRYYRDRIFPKELRDRMADKVQKVRDQLDLKIKNSLQTVSDLHRYYDAYDRYKANQYYAAQQVYNKKQSLK